MPINTIALLVLGVAAFVGSIAFLWGAAQFLTSRGDKLGIELARGKITFGVFIFTSASVLLVVEQLIVTVPLTITLPTLIAIVAVILLVLANRLSSKILDTKNKIKDKYPNLSIIGIILQRKQNTIFTTQILLSLSLFISFIFNVSTLSRLSLTFILIFSVLRIHVLEYRIRKGLYGTNKYEAREIIQFIIENSKNIDFTDDGKTKKIATPDDLDKLKTQTKKSLVRRPKHA